jgi:hypothetical protein
MKMQRPTDSIAISGTIDPEAQGAGTVVSDYVSMAEFATVMAVIMVGTMATNSTVDAKLVQATDSSGTGSKDITGKAITQLTQAGTDSDKQAVIEACGEDLDVDNSFTHVALSITVATAASDLAGLVLGCNPRYGPASNIDLASVDEIVGLDA